MVGPEGRGKHHPVERGKVRAAVVKAVEGIVVAVEPQGRVRERSAALEQRAVDLSRVRASFGHPAAHEIDHAGDLAPGDYARTQCEAPSQLREKSSRRPIAPNRRG